MMAAQEAKYLKEVLQQMYRHRIKLEEQLDSVKNSIEDLEAMVEETTEEE